MGSEDLIRYLAETNPAVLTALLGAGTGGVVGAFTSDSGEEARGGLAGAALGGALGTAGGMMSGKGRDIAEMLLPSKEKALMAGALLGGGVGGYHAKQVMEPWIKERLMEAGIQERKARAQKMASETKANPKAEETKVANEQEKQAELQKEASDRLMAFEVGFEEGLKKAGLQKEAVAKQLNLAPELVAPAVIEWLTKEEAK